MPADLDRVFFLDDDDLKLVGKHCGEHMRAGFALQLVTVRWLGMFLEEPLDVPDGVLEFVAGKQLGAADLSTVARYTERGHTRFDQMNIAGWIGGRHAKRSSLGRYRRRLDDL
ncbi:MAG TPA: DUF4158 domain-containing protein [Streptosporangiaceae bacterium]|jgi:hypothetical protein|nr:DUF4158 domain-containing protein [Streptosporangiaceae bacterium]